MCKVDNDLILYVLEIFREKCYLHTVVATGVTQRNVMLSSAELTVIMLFGYCLNP